MPAPACGLGFFFFFAALRDAAGVEEGFAGRRGSRAGRGLPAGRGARGEDRSNGKKNGWVD